MRSGEHINPIRLPGLSLLKVLGLVRKDSGSSLVEMAVVFPILGAMLFGIIQFSMALYTYDFLSDAAREGARWAIVRGGQCSTNTPNLDHCGALQADVQSHVQGLGFPYANSSTVTLSYQTATTGMDSSGNPTTTWSACTGTNCNQPGNQVRVLVQCVYPIGVPFWKATQLTMTSSSSMVISQ